MDGLRTRFLIRVFVAGALSVSLLAGSFAPVPEDLPALAYGQSSLYRLEVALLVFYGNLLIITPTVSGLFWGRLPTEISIRGASFAEEAARSAERDEAAVRNLEHDSARFADELAQAKLAIEELQARGDRK